MSTSGIRNIGVNQPIAPKESVPVKKKDESSKTEKTSATKDSFKISDDGLKLDTVLKDLANVKEILDSDVDSARLIRATTSGLEPEFLQDEVQDIMENLANVLDEAAENPNKMVQVHGNLTTENVLSLELPEIEEITSTFSSVEQFISDNPQAALGAQANL